MIKKNRPIWGEAPLLVGGLGPEPLGSPLDPTLVAFLNIGAIFTQECLLS